MAPAKEPQKSLTVIWNTLGPISFFISGDGDPALSPPAGFGLFHWYELPLMLLGLAICGMRFNSSRAARILLVWIVLYPVSDILFAHVTTNSLRSLPGLPALVLLEAAGAVGAARYPAKRRRDAWAAVCSGMAVVVLISNVLFLQQFFGDFRRQKQELPIFGADVVQAAQWLRPKLSNVNAVFVSAFRTHPHIFTLVGLQYDPEQWFRDVREVIPGPLPNGTYRGEDVYLRYGKMYFLHTESVLGEVKALSQNGRPDRVIFILRPGELDLDKYARPVYQIRNPDGQVVLWIFDLSL